MPIERITADDLRDMEHQEGLVLQGCGGEAQEWLDGINDLLTQDGILQNGSRFETVKVFQHDGLNNLLFPPVADPTDPAQDEKARAMGLRLLESCQQMNVYGPVWTDGMWQEIYKAGELGIPVLTDQKTIGRTPPARHPKRKER